MQNYIGADIDLNSGQYKILELLDRLEELNSAGLDWYLHLTGHRNQMAQNLVWNEIEMRGLGSCADFWPYTDLCRRFPIFKHDADYWIDNQSSLEEVRSIGIVANPLRFIQRSVLFVTYMHPWKDEGNSRLMRDWLEKFRASGYRIHLLYYAGDQLGTVTPEMRSAAHRMCSLYLEIPVKSKLVGSNRNGLNVHIDDWCGPELLDEVSRLVRTFSYDMAFVNYAFLSAVFERVHAYTEKVLLTHDRFEDRNKRMLEQGFLESGWVSLTQAGERLACQRADTVIALQNDEAAYFEKLAGEAAKVITVSPVLPWQPQPINEIGDKLRIGYFGSHNWVNELNFGAFLDEWLRRPELVRGSSFVLAGGICEELSDFISSDDLEQAAPVLLGKVEHLSELFTQCDIIINPERGGTGLKIKSLETMAFGMPLLSTRAGAVGFDSEHKFHNAANFKDLADLVLELVRDRSLISIARDETHCVYKNYYERNVDAVRQIIGTDLRERSNAPKVSIIVPFFNVQDHIQECLDSIRTQDYPSFEILLVDDQSPDSSRSIADRAAIEDDRVSIITHTENRGLGSSRNTGVSAATGDYLFFLDSDDVLAGPFVLRMLVNSARATNSEVVTARATRLHENSMEEPFDEFHENIMEADCDKSYEGLEAFFATFGKGRSYLPMRAWGYLIDANLYRRSKIEFPVGAHEDIGVVPILNFLANRVHYSSQKIVKYRANPMGISNTPWSTEKAQELVGVWRHFSSLLSRFRLQEHRGFSALQTARQALWKIQTNAIDLPKLEQLFEAFSEILFDVDDTTPIDALIDGIRHLSDTLAFVRAPEELCRRTLAVLPTSCLINYHRQRLTDYRAADKFSSNHKRVNKIINQYRHFADEESKTYLSMLTEADKAVYYDAALNYRGLGDIVDAGCFVGETTYHFIHGLLDNPLFPKGDPRLDRIIKVYDLLQIDDDYILDHLRRNSPEKPANLAGDFETAFHDQMEQFTQYFDVFPGDVMKSVSSFDRPIEILGVDLCKALPVTDYVIRNFFPRIISGGLVIQQDFNHEFHPHIHLSMLRLDDYFDLDAEMKWGGSVTFRLNHPITEALIKERFGGDQSWFEEIDRNVGLLERLIERTNYDENRWAMILNLGFYYHAIGDMTKAKKTYERAVRRFPQFETNMITRKHLYEQ